MNVAISAPIFDLDGHVLLTGVSADGLAELERRNSRVATLDGQAVISDFGYSDSDRTLTVRWRVASRIEIERVTWLVKTYSRLIIATEEGCFVGAPGAFSLSSGEAQMQIMVEKRIDG